VSNPTVNTVVRAAVAVAQEPPPFSSSAFPGVVPPCDAKKLAGNAYAGFAAVDPDITVIAAAVTADPDAGMEYSSSAWVPVRKLIALLRQS
jgi:hypothetical protein